MRKRLRTVMFGIGLMILLAQPAFAEELGQANITPRTKMAEIRSNPSIVGAGIYTYSLDQDRVLDRMYWDAQPLSRLSNHWTAQDAADGLNYLIRTYNAGQRVTFPLYTAEEIAQDTANITLPLYAKAMSLPLDEVIRMVASVNPAIKDLNGFIILATIPFNVLKVGLNYIVGQLLFVRLRAAKIVPKAV